MDESGIETSRITTIAKKIDQRSESSGLSDDGMFKDKLEFLTQGSHLQELYQNRNIPKLVDIYEQSKEKQNDAESENSLRVLVQIAREDWKEANPRIRGKALKTPKIPESAKKLISAVGVKKEDQSTFARQFFPFYSLGEAYKTLTVLTENPVLYDRVAHPDSYSPDQLIKFRGALSTEFSTNYRQDGKVLARLYETNTPAARDLMRFTEINHKMPDQEWQTSHKELMNKSISVIPGLDSHLQWSNFNIDRRREMLRISETRSTEETARLVSSDTIPIKELNRAYQLMLVRNINKHVTEDSRSPKKKDDADRRNREISKKVNPLAPGTLLHGAPVDILPSLFLNGSRSGDFLGEKITGDNTQYGMDFLTVLPEDFSEEGSNSEESQKQKFLALFDKSGASEHGPSLESRERMTLLFDRTSDNAFMKGMEYGSYRYEGRHKLILVGLPSTEISGIIIYDQDPDNVKKVSQEIVKNGFYIPVYGIDGKLVLTPERYDELTNVQKKL